MAKDIEIIEIKLEKKVARNKSFAFTIVET
jgi:hypothetical protein